MAIKPSILFVAGTLGKGGAEKQLLLMLTHLKHAGYRVHLACLTTGEWYQPQIEALGIPVLHIRGSRLKKMARIAMLARKLKPDFVHSAHFYTNIYAAVAAKAAGAKSIGASRNDLHREIAEHPKWMGMASVKWPSILVANTMLSTEIGKKMRNGKTVYLPNAFQPPAAPPQIIKSPMPTVAGAGRLVPQKRFDIFLQVAAEYIKNHDDNIQFVIYGTGSLLGQLQAQAEHLGISGHVTFAGLVEDLPAHLQQAHCLLLTSDFEGTPNVVLEALSVGIPVVAREAGDVSEYVNGENGAYFNKNADPTAIASGLYRVMHQTFAPEKLREKVELLKPEIIFSQLEALYK